MPDLPQRLLLCRPHGGLNDQLVQIEKCRDHARRFGRVLTVDTGRDGIRDAFLDYFEPLPSFGVELLPYSAELAERLDGIGPTRPPEVQGQISSYRSESRDGNTWMAGTGVALGLDLTRDHPEPLLLHESFGGGRGSVELLRHLALTPEVAAEVTRRVTALGPNYDAVHIRHSDYRTEYHGFLAAIAPALLGRRVLLATDSHEVQQAAPKLLPGTRLLRLGAVPETGGKPLHELQSGDQQGRNIDALADLLALAGAKRLWFTHVGARVISGFCLLAEGLRIQPDVQRQFLSQAPEPLRLRFEAQLTATCAAGLGPGLRLRQAWVALHQFRSNRLARRRRRDLRRDLRRANQ